MSGQLTQKTTSKDNATVSRLAANKTMFRLVVRISSLSRGDLRCARTDIKSKVTLIVPFRNFIFIFYRYFKYFVSLTLAAHPDQRNLNML